MTVHLAGVDVHYDTHVRQRCSWCGSILIDQDLSRIAVPTEQLDENGEYHYPTWPIGSLVEVTGENPVCSHTVEAVPSVEDPTILKAPADCCLRLPYELTLSVGGEC